MAESSWSVLLEYGAPEKAEAPAGDDTRWDEVEAAAGVITHGPRRYSIRMFVNDDDAVRAAQTARDIAWKAICTAGLPDWPCVRLDVIGETELDAELATSPFPQLLGAAELARHLGVSRQRIAELRQRPDFPRPLVELAATPLWLEQAIDAFIDGWDRRPGARGGS